MYVHDQEYWDSPRQRTQYSYTFSIPILAIEAAEDNMKEMLKLIEKSVRGSIIMRKTDPHYRGYGNGSCEIVGEHSAIHQGLALMVAFVRLSAPARYPFWTHPLQPQNMHPIQLFGWTDQAIRSKKPDDQHPAHSRYVERDHNQRVSGPMQGRDNYCSQVHSWADEEGSEFSTTPRPVTQPVTLVTEIGSDRQLQKPQLGNFHQEPQPGSPAPLVERPKPAHPASSSIPEPLCSVTLDEPVKYSFESTTPPYDPQEVSFESTTPPYDPEEVFARTPTNSQDQPATPVIHNLPSTPMENYNNPSCGSATKHDTSSQETPSGCQLVNENSKLSHTTSPPDDLKCESKDVIVRSMEISLEAREHLSANQFEVVRQVILESQAFCRLSMTPNCLRFLAVGTEEQVSLALVLLSIKLKELSG